MSILAFISANEATAPGVSAPWEGGRSSNVDGNSIYCLLSATTNIATLCHVCGDQRRNDGIVESMRRWFFLPAQQHSSFKSNCIGSRLNWLESAVALNPISVFHNEESRKTDSQLARDKLGRTHCQHLLHTLDATVEETWCLSDSNDTNKASGDNGVYAIVCVSSAVL